MAREILGEFGPDSSQPQRPSATNGGQPVVKEMPYDPPKGPSGINDGRSPGIHGDNHGNCGTQGRH